MSDTDKTLEIKLDDIANNISKKADVVSVNEVKAIVEEIKSADAEKTAKIADLEQKNADLEVAFSRIEVKANPADELREYKNELDTYLTKSNPRHEIKSEYVEKAAKVYVGELYPHIPVSKKELAVKSLVENINPAGGYLVTPDRLAGVSMLTNIWDNPIRQYAAIATIGGDRLQLNVRDRFTGAAWLGETESATENTENPFKEIEIQVHDIGHQFRASQNLLMDAGADIEGMILSDARENIDYTEGYAFLLGDGVKKPMGILSYTTTSSKDVYGQLQYKETASADTFDLDDLIDLETLMHPRLRPGCVICMNSQTLGFVKKFKDDDGQYVYKREMTNAGQVDRVLGYPVALLEDMASPLTATTFTAGTYPVMLANFGISYQIVDRIGMFIQRDPYTAWPKVRWNTLKRVGGGLKRFDAIKLLKIKA